MLNRLWIFVAVFIFSTEDIIRFNFKRLIYTKESIKPLGPKLTIIHTIDIKLSKNDHLSFYQMKLGRSARFVYLASSWLKIRRIKFNRSKLIPLTWQSFYLNYKYCVYIKLSWSCLIHTHNPHTQRVVLFVLKPKPAHWSLN